MFDLLLRDATDKGIAEACQRAGDLIGRLDKAGSIDPKTGKVTVNEKQLREALTAFFPPEVVDEQVKAAQQLAWQGSVRLADESGKAVVLPWAVVPSMAEAGLAPLSLYRTLGVKAGADPEDLARQLGQTQPWIRESSLTAVPLDSLAIGAAVAEQRSRLLEEMRDQSEALLREQEARARREAEEAHDAAEREAAEAALREAERRRLEMERRPADAAACLLNRSEWSVHWWGVQLCLDRECTQLLQTVLGSYGGGDRLRGAVEGAIRAGTTGAASFVVGLATGVIASIYLFVLSIAISLVSGPRGVCLNFNWIALAYSAGAFTVIPTPR